MNFPRTAPLFFAFLLTLGFPVSTAYSREDVDSVDKLALLNTATGRDSSANSFQRRVDSIMEINPNTNRDYIADQDYEDRVQMQQLKDKEQADLAKLLYPPPSAKDKDQGPKIDGRMEPDYANEGPSRLRQDGTDRAHQQTTADIYQELEEEKKKKDALALEQSEGESKASENTDPNALPPSLANNPFYTGPPPEETSDEKTNFEMNRGVVVSRLVRGFGMATEDAAKLVRSASSREELIIMIMQEQGLTYGQSSDLTE